MCVTWELLQPDVGYGVFCGRRAGPRVLTTWRAKDQSMQRLDRHGGLVGVSPKATGVSRRVAEAQMEQLVFSADSDATGTQT